MSETAWKLRSSTSGITTLFNIAGLIGDVVSVSRVVIQPKMIDVWIQIVLEASCTFSYILSHITLTPTDSGPSTEKTSRRDLLPDSIVGFVLDESGEVIGSRQGLEFLVDDWSSWNRKIGRWRRKGLEIFGGRITNDILASGSGVRWIRRRVES